MHGETIRTLTRLSDTLLDTSLVDWTSQLELSLAKFDIHTIQYGCQWGVFFLTPCCRNLAKVRVFLMDENNIGIKEFRKDLMEDGFESRERHNLSMDIYYKYSQDISSSN